MSHARDATYTIGLSASAGFGCSRNMNAASVRKKPSTDLSAWRLRLYRRIRILPVRLSAGRRSIASQESSRTTKLSDRTNKLRSKRSGFRKEDRGKGFWCEVGAAWPHKDGDGLDIVIH